MIEDDSTYPAEPDASRTAPLAPDRADEPLAAGAVLDGKLRIESAIGVGGMGVVYEAMHLELGERVAVKVLRQGVNQGRLRREARIGLRMRGEHVVRVMDVGSLAWGARYVVMERLVGDDLGGVLRARGPLPVEDAVDYVLQACEAMAEAHALGVVHRDLKPSNLFLTRRPDGSPLVKVLDFGVATAGTLAQEGGAPGPVTDSSAVLGSPRYMAPEQIRGARRVDARADVWALGVILHELVAGAPPFPGELPSAVLAAIAADPPARLRDARPDAPEALEEVVLRCLEKDPAQRIPSVGALAAGLAPFAPRRSAVTLERIAGIASAAESDFERARFLPEPPRPVPSVPPVVAAGGSAPSRRWLGVVAAGAVAAASAGAFVRRADHRQAAPVAAAPSQRAPEAGPPVAAQPAREAPASAPSITTGGDPASPPPHAVVPVAPPVKPAMRAAAPRAPAVPRVSSSASPSAKEPPQANAPDVEAATADRH